MVLGPGFLVALVRLAMTAYRGMRPADASGGDEGDEGDDRNPDRHLGGGRPDGSGRDRA